VEGEKQEMELTCSLNGMAEGEMRAFGPSSYWGETRLSASDDEVHATTWTRLGVGRYLAGDTGMSNLSNMVQML
jgi:hypothetical protein